MLPLSVVLHALFGLILYSNRHILISDITSEPTSPTLSTHFNTQRLTQYHVVVFIWSSVAIISFILLEVPIIRFLSLLSSLFTKCYRYIRSFDEPQTLSHLSSDILLDYRFDQLYFEWRKTQIQLEKVQVSRAKGAYTDIENRRYIDKYVSILQRNLGQMQARLLKLSEIHLERIQEVDETSHMMVAQQKIQTVYEYFSQAIDKNNPLRAQISIDEVMFGRMSQNSIQSFDLLDNPQYRELESLVAMLIEDAEGPKKQDQLLAPLRGPPNEIAFYDNQR